MVLVDTPSRDTIPLNLGEFDMALDSYSTALEKLFDGETGSRKSRDTFPLMKHISVKNGTNIKNYNVE
jgi:hypothetical protein